MALTMMCFIGYEYSLEGFTPLLYRTLWQWFNSNAVVTSRTLVTVKTRSKY